MIVIKEILRVLVLPITLLLLLVTAILEFVTLEFVTNGNWKYWKEYNKSLLKALPFKK